MSSAYQVLFNGELTDAPGRCETWTESVRYAGNNRWELKSDGTDFYGSAPAETIKEAFGTQSLVRWVLERDAEDLESQPRIRNAESGQDEDLDAGNHLGPRAARLLEIARAERADFCIKCLMEWVEGKWPKPKRMPPPPKILGINGVIKRGVWVHVYHAVYDVETTAGPGYLDPPKEGARASLHLKQSNPSAPGWLIRLTKRQMVRIEELKPALETLLHSLA